MIGTALAAGGCPGGRDDNVIPADSASGADVAQQQGARDSGGPGLETWPFPPEAGPSEAGAAADAPGATSPGAPCPCADPLVCHGGICRSPCTRQACNSGVGCSAEQACVLSSAGTAVCVPGKRLAESCNPGTPCRTGFLCLSSSAGGTGTCYANCTHVACPNGETCRTLSGSSCRYCAP